MKGCYHNWDMAMPFRHCCPQASFTTRPMHALVRISSCCHSTTDTTINTKSYPYVKNAQKYDGGNIFSIQILEIFLINVCKCKKKCHNSVFTPFSNAWINFINSVTNCPVYKVHLIIEMVVFTREKRVKNAWKKCHNSLENKYLSTLFSHLF